MQRGGNRGEAGEERFTIKEIVDAIEKAGDEIDRRFDRESLELPDTPIDFVAQILATGGADHFAGAIDGDHLDPSFGERECRGASAGGEIEGAIDRDAARGEQLQRDLGQSGAEAILPRAVVDFGIAPVRNAHARAATNGRTISKAAESLALSTPVS